MSEFKVIVDEKEPGSFVISLFGSLDSEHYQELEARVIPLITASTKVIMFDMTQLVYISSMGINTLIKIRRGLEQHRARLALVNLQPQVKKVFDIIKALPLDTIFRSVEEADVYLTEIQRNEMKKGKSV